jgi:thiopeptide-type bacteriocin biosynthesis protein
MGRDRRVTTPAVVDLVLESLRGGDVAARCRQLGVSPEAFGAARRAFVSAGTAAVHEALPGERWLQLDVALDSRGELWRRFVCGSFQDDVADWLRRRPDSRFYFMHKPPGLRLRFAGADPPLSRSLHALLESLGARSTALPYDAEPHLFGGAAGLELAHHCFTLESAAVLAYHRLWLSGATRLGRSEFSLALLHQLLRAVTGDRWELWDVWCKLELAGRLPYPAGSSGWRDGAPPAEAQAAALALLEDGGVRRVGASPAEQEVLARWAAGVPALAADVARANQNGALLWGIREIVPFWVVFHWNRMAFSLDEQRRLALLMTHALSPRR